MKVFISWSGEQSKAVALKLRDWLPIVLHYVRPWVSASDIDAGKRWSDEVAQELDQSSFGILCLTPENLHSPWILFEAGALAKSIETGGVVPYLIGVDFTDITGPLTQFQGKKADEESTLQLVLSINTRQKEPIPDERVRELFGYTWPKLRDALVTAPKQTKPAASTRPVEVVLEELVQLVRSIDIRTNGHLSIPESESILTPRHIDQSSLSLSDLPDRTKFRVVRHILLGSQPLIFASLRSLGVLPKDAPFLITKWKNDLAAVKKAIVEGSIDRAADLLCDVAQKSKSECASFVDSIISDLRPSC